jgi:hypothetical protein
MNTFTYARLEPIWPGDGRTFAAAFAANIILKKGTVVGQISSAAANEVQSLTISGTPTGGTFTLTFGGQTTTPIAFNATAAAVQTALAALSSIGSGNITCSGGPLPGSAITVTFNGLLANQPQSLMVGATALTGGTSPALAIARVTSGVANGKWAAYASGNADGTQVAKGIVAIDIATDTAGRVTYGAQPAGGEHGEKYPSAPIFYKGEFRILDLLGLDTASLPGFARLISGSITDGVVSLL